MWSCRWKLVLYMNYNLLATSVVQGESRILFMTLRDSTQKKPKTISTFDYILRTSKRIPSCRERQTIV